MSLSRMLPVLAPCAVLLTVANAAAIEITLNLVQSQSTILFTGDYLGTAANPVNPLLAQDDAMFPTPGITDLDPTRPSNQTTLQGTITVDVDNVTAPTTIQILSADMDGDVNGSWLPESQPPGGGLSSEDPADPAEPADLGLKVVIFGFDAAYGAVRDFAYNFATETDPDGDGPMPFEPVIEPVNPQGEFSSLSQRIVYRRGFFDTWLDPAVDDDRDRDDLTGDDALNQHVYNNAVDPATVTPLADPAESTYIVSGNLVTLTIPINIDVDDQGSLSQYFDGQFVATYTIPASLDGDFNSDGKVDAADYVVWRNGDSPDDTQAGYDLWKANFGNPPGAGGGQAGIASVPEPASVALTFFALIGLWFARPTRR